VVFVVPEGDRRGRFAAPGRTIGVAVLAGESHRRGVVVELFEEHDSAGSDRRRDVGLDHAYAVTSYAVTGATQPVSTSRIDDTSSRAETYVDITRGEQANNLYLTRASDPLDGEHRPHVPPDPIATMVAERLERSTGEKTAWEIRQDRLESLNPAPGRGLGLG
jgi:hypothetical protein